MCKNLVVKSSNSLTLTLACTYIKPKPMSFASLTKRKEVMAFVEKRYMVALLSVSQNQDS